MKTLTYVRDGDFYGDLKGTHIIRVPELVREVDGYVSKRHYHWVLYGSNGEYIDDDMSRNDLAERWGIALNHPYIEEDFYPNGLTLSRKVI